MISLVVVDVAVIVSLVTKVLACVVCSIAQRWRWSGQEGFTEGRDKESPYGPSLCFMTPTAPKSIVRVVLSILVSLRGQGDSYSPAPPTLVAVVDRSMIS